MDDKRLPTKVASPPNEHIIIIKNHKCMIRVRRMKDIHRRAAAVLGNGVEQDFASIARS